MTTLSPAATPIEDYALLGDLRDVRIRLQELQAVINLGGFFDVKLRQHGVHRQDQVLPRFLQLFEALPRLH
jgi:hypothetical protein